MLTKTSHEDIDIITSAKPLFGRVLFAAKSYKVGTLLIDGGIPVGNEFFALTGDLSAVCITHPHPDHIGYAAPLRRRFDIPVYVSEEGMPVLADPLVPPYPIRIVVPYAEPCAGTGCPGEITGGTARLSRMDMPGHTDDHICFYDGEHGRAFTGDLLLWGSSKWVGPGVDMEKAIASLEQLKELDLAIAYPGHGKPIKGPNSLIEEKVGRMRSFGKKVYALHDKGLSERDIQVRLLGHEEGMFFFSRGYFSKRNLIRSYLLSLD